jgi:aminoglycoside N3'-acetyltransferase
VNTCFHGIEAMAEAAYLLREQRDEFTVVDASGDRQTVSIRRHRKKIPRRFAETEALLVREGIVTKGKVGPAASLLAEAGPMRDFVVGRLRDDPGFLLKNPERDLPIAVPGCPAAGRQPANGIAADVHRN